MCNGQEEQKTSKGRRKKKRPNKKPESCGTEFDYEAWRDWGDWRRGEDQHQTGLHRKVMGGCEDWCDYPSQCMVEA